ncbi:MAG: hypothetical protein M3328_13465, partial [Chloroflexota bacterium]|nr:hypothetical protein [Chloroflexota bacterium]
PRVVKCPTPGCPGWITLDITRHQTEPCRYCRIGVDTLRFLLSRVGAEHKALPPEVHDEFNRLMLTMAGAWSQNVYLRPSPGTLVDLKAGVHGVVIEYNPLLGNAGEDGAAPLIGIILHKLLHFEAHLGQRGPQLAIKSGSRDKEGLMPLMTYLLTITDHAWVTARLEQLNPSLREAQSRWGLDVAQMLVGSESMYNRYLSERNLQKIVAVLKETTDPVEFRNNILARLATLTTQTVEREKEETRRLYLAEQLANVHLMNAEAYPEYQEALEATGLQNVRDAYSLAERLYTELSTSPAAQPPAQAAKDGDAGHAVILDSGQFYKVLEGAVKALGMANYFDVKS